MISDNTSCCEDIDKLKEMYKTEADPKDIKQHTRRIHRIDLTSNNFELVQQALWWFIAQGEESDLLYLSQIKLQIDLSPSQVLLYTESPDLIDLLQQANNNIVLRTIKQKKPLIYQLAEQLFSNDNAIVQWFITSKNFLDGRTPLACLDSPEKIMLLEKQMEQSLAGVCA
jgi:hypothetical protein